jgi:hypothetical protein
MMTASRILNYVTAEPFRPFRLRMASGDSFEIRHPEMVQVGETTDTIFTWMSDDPDGPSEREREISVLLIESIEQLSAQIAREQS